MTREVRVGDVKIGGNNPISVQSMTNTDTRDVEKTVAQIKRLEELGFGNLPICIAKTQYSFSDDATALGAPSDFTVTVRNVKISAGAGFIVVLTGKIMTMPGLPKVPAAEKIDVDEDGKIYGLF